MKINDTVKITRGSHRGEIGTIVRMDNGWIGVNLPDDIGLWIPSTTVKVVK